MFNVGDRVFYKGDTTLEYEIQHFFVSIASYNFAF